MIGLTTSTMDVAVFAISSLAFAFWRRSQSSVAKGPTGKDLLQRFPSLTLLGDQKAPPLIGLFFVASWCPDCWEITPMVEKLAAKAKDSIAIYYISSDYTAEQMKSYCKEDIFIPVPFANVSERSAIKRHFKTCAKKEMQDIYLTERKSGTPTLIVLDPRNGSVVTTKGIDDCIKKDPAACVGGWKASL